jgi:hypothetical protein
MELTQYLVYRFRLRRRLRSLSHQAYRPTRPTFVQCAIIVVGCMVAAFVWWGSVVILLALGHGPVR